MLTLATMAALRAGRRSASGGVGDEAHISRNSCCFAYALWYENVSARARARDLEQIMTASPAKTVIIKRTPGDHGRTSTCETHATNRTHSYLRTPSKLRI
eukprot:246875-Prymnesium_polylepis.1